MFFPQFLGKFVAANTAIKMPLDIYTLQVELSYVNENTVTEVYYRESGSDEWTIVGIFSPSYTLKASFTIQCGVALRNYIASHTARSAGSDPEPMYTELMSPAAVEIKITSTNPVVISAFKDL